ncbi:hypothetical protein B0T18DRAFT_327174 [Schizothecium vesticola]|uniref:Uncharacterized protein n=1 Tax=Schizothecium vesticola TaxID=314040 RepID=A0AA40K5V7_9PEZI|nr:hypothetical protein B0T18DRAFT_327174 [Schizothecium vesticola]
MAIPNIERDFTMECDLHPSIPLGSGPGDTKYNWISFSGGVWNATWGKGTIEHGGHDYQFVLPDLSAKATTQYLLKTSDEVPAYIEIQSDGWIKGPLEVMQSLNNASTRDAVDPTSYYFRLMVTMNTGDERYTHVNTSLWVASARRMNGKVVYEAYIVS